MNYPVRKIHRKERFVVEFTTQEQGMVIATTDLMEATRPVGYVSHSWRTCLDTSLWEDVILACKTCGKEALLYANGYCSQACQDKALSSKKTNGSNDGSKNSFYAIPEWVEDVDDLAEYLKLDGFEFNVLKSLWAHIGDRHSGTNVKREANKRVHYANRSVAKIIRAEEEARNESRT